MDTITQLSDRINCFLQLFILKLRSCSICRRHTAIIPSFWAVHTIRYFLTEFIRFHPIFSPLFRFFVRPSIRGNRSTFVNFQPRSGPTAGIWSVAFATKHFPSCILQEGGNHLSSFSPQSVKDALAPGLRRLFSRNSFSTAAALPMLPNIRVFLAFPQTLGYNTGKRCCFPNLRHRTGKSVSILYMV